MTVVTVISLGRKYGPERPEVWAFHDVQNNDAWYETEAADEQTAIAQLDAILNPPPPPAPKLENVGLKLNEVIQKLVDHGVTQIGEIEPVKPAVASAQPSETDGPEVITP